MPETIRMMREIKSDAPVFYVIEKPGVVECWIDIMNDALWSGIAGNAECHASTVHLAVAILRNGSMQNVGETHFRGRILGDAYVRTISIEHLEKETFPYVLKIEKLTSESNLVANSVCVQDLWILSEKDREDRAAIRRTLDLDWRIDLCGMENVMWRAIMDGRPRPHHYAHGGNNAASF